MTAHYCSVGSADFDVLTTHIADLQVVLDSGLLTSVDLVGKYLAQIEQHNTAGIAVRALISVAPRASLLKQASDLDMDRKLWGRRGPMHGIPVIVKVFRTQATTTEIALLTLERILSGLIRRCIWIQPVVLLRCEARSLREMPRLSTWQVESLGLIQHHY